MSAAGLVLRGVEAAPGGRPVLTGVDLGVAPGEVVGLLGPNGAGKTTLLRVVARLLEPRAGTLLWAGEAIASRSRRALARIVATVPQDLHVPFPFTVSEVVLMGRAPHHGRMGLESASDLEIARAALDRMGIEALSDRSILELSGGERQLVLFARALVQQPSLLLLDEPTAFLDLRHRIDVLEVVRELAQAGCAALVVSHDLGLAARVCDRLVVLADGEVQADGAPSNVLTTEILESAFGMRADVVMAPDGKPLVVPRIRD